MGNEVPEILDMRPPSPNAYEMTKYGDVPINEHLGKVTTSVEVHNYKAGMLNLPITLNYIGNGVKVDQTCTIMGLNWTLNAGGVITRTINDLPDEYYGPSYRQYHISQNTVNLMSNGSQEAAFYNTVLGWGSNNYDTKPDEFSFNFNGYSGTFYLDENYTPVVTNQESELKVKIIGSDADNRINFYDNKSFLITTPDGVKYFFEDYEETWITYAGPHTPQSGTIRPTSFYLTRIEHPLDGVINFTYESLQNPFKIKLYDNYIYTKAVRFSQPTRNCGNVNNSSFDQPLDSKSVFLNTQNGKFLKTISSSNTTEIINFELEDGSLDNGLYEYRYQLDKIQIGKGGFSTNTLFKEVDLTYTNSERFLLTDIQFKAKQLYQSQWSDGKHYEYTYNSPQNMPARFSTGQDHLGYYNGKNTNNTLIGKDEYGNDLSNRNYEFDLSLFGALKKITYPTGGYTEFEYEPKLTKKWTDTLVNMQIYDYSGPVDKITDEFDIGCMPNCVGGNSTYFQNMSTPINIKFIGQKYTGNNRVKFHFEVTDKYFDDDGVYVEEKIIDASQAITFTDFNQDDCCFNIDYSLTLKEYHAYSFDLYLDNTYTGGAGNEWDASVIFSYPNGQELVNGGGIRVKKITDYAEDNSPENIKRFYYTDPTRIYKNKFSYRQFYAEPEYGEIKFMETNCTANDGQFPLTPMINYALYSGSTKSKDVENLEKYRDVTISYGGDDFEEGGVYKKFSLFEVMDTGFLIEPDLAFPYVNGYGYNFNWSYLTDQVLNYQDNEGEILNGTLRIESTLVKKGTKLHIKKEKENIYEIDTFDELSGIIGKKLFTQIDFPTDGGQCLAIKNYPIYLSTKNLIDNSEKFYIEPQSIAETSLGVYDLNQMFLADYDGDGIRNYMDDFDDSFVPTPQNPKIVETKTTYDYISYVGQPTEITTETSNSDVEKIVRNYYPGQVTLHSCLDNLILQHYVELVNQHRILSPYQTETYVKEGGVERLTSVKRVIYDLYNSTTGLNPVTFDDILMPSKVQTSKTGECDLEDRFEYLEYNEDGYPTLLKKTNGSLTKLVYNSRNQVVRIVENFTKDNGPPTYNLGDSDLVICEKRIAQYYTSLNPDVMITDYGYDNLTHQLIWKKDPRCQKTNYEYDDFHRLKYIKDMDGNILKEYDYNYKN